MRLEVLLSPLCRQGENTKKVCAIFQRLQSKLAAESSDQKLLCSCQGPQKYVAISPQENDISLESIPPPVALGDIALSLKTLTCLEPPDKFPHKGQCTNAKGRLVWKSAISLAHPASRTASKGQSMEEVKALWDRRAAQADGWGPEGSGFLAERWGATGSDEPI